MSQPVPDRLPHTLFPEVAVSIPPGTVSRARPGGVPSTDALMLPARGTLHGSNYHRQRSTLDDTVSVDAYIKYFR